MSQVKNIVGAGLPVIKVHPAICSKAMAGYIGPFLSSSSSKAIPRYSPSSANASVPLVISSRTPRHPVLLNDFPYYGPFAPSQCLSCPIP